MRIALVTPGISASEDDWCIPALWDLVRALTSQDPERAVASEDAGQAFESQSDLLRAGARRIAPAALKPPALRPRRLAPARNAPTMAASDDVTVFALRYPHTRTPYDLFGARVVPFGAAQSRFAGRLLMWLRAYLAIRKQAGQLDLIHALWAHEPAALALHAARASGAPVVVSLMGGELVDLPEIGYGGLRDRGNGRFVRRALREAAALTAGSEALARTVRQRSGRRCAVLPLGIDPARFQPTGPRHALAGDPALLVVGSLVAVKDHATLLQAFARLGRSLPGARLHLVGEGPLRARLATLSGQLGIASRVHYHGPVDHGDLAGFYRAADALVVASRFESQNLVALEAAACGCPVLGTAVGILPELGGPVAQPGDARALATLLTGAFAQPEALATLTAAQRQRVLEHFTVAHCVDRLRRLYTEVAAGR